MFAQLNIVLAVIGLQQNSDEVCSPVNNLLGLTEKVRGGRFLRFFFHNRLYECSLTRKNKNVSGRAKLL